MQRRAYSAKSTKFTNAKHAKLRIRRHGTSDALSIVMSTAMIVGLLFSFVVLMFEPPQPLGRDIRKGNSQ
jgi:hypothetical protein